MGRVDDDDADRAAFDVEGVRRAACRDLGRADAVTVGVSSDLLEKRTLGKESAARIGNDELTALDRSFEAAVIAARAVVRAAAERRLRVVALHEIPLDED